MAKQIKDRLQFLIMAFCLVIGGITLAACGDDDDNDLTKDDSTKKRFYKSRFYKSRWNSHQQIVHGRPRWNMENHAHEKRGIQRERRDKG